MSEDPVRTEGSSPARAGAAFNSPSFFAALRGGMMLVGFCLQLGDEVRFPCRVQDTVPVLSDGS